MHTIQLAIEHILICDEKQRYIVQHSNLTFPDTNPLRQQWSFFLVSFSIGRRREKKKVYVFTPVLWFTLQNFCETQYNQFRNFFDHLRNHCFISLTRFTYNSELLKKNKRIKWKIYYSLNIVFTITRFNDDPRTNGAK